MAQSYRRIRVAIARINSYLQEHIIGIVVLQLVQPRSAAAAQEFERVNREHMDAYKDAITAYGWFYPVVEFSRHAGAGGHPGLRRIPHASRRR